jgi:uncharacterized protein YkwD
MGGKSAKKEGVDMRSISRTITALFLLSIAPHIVAEAAETKAKAKLKISRPEQKLIDLTNQERKKANLPPLQPNPILFATARAHSANMAKQGKLQHVLDNKGVEERLDDAKYYWLSVGENIATGRKDSSVEEVMEGWMESKGHRDNILKKKFTEIGIGIAADGKGNFYYTQVFGREKKKKKAD